MSMDKSVKKRECVVCGESVKTLSNNPLCSKDCKIERAQNKINDMSDYDAHCPICGESRHSVASTLYHINESTDLAHRDITLYKTTTCKYCDREFRKKRPPHTNIFCSKQCHINHIRENTEYITFECERNGCDNMRTVYKKQYETQNSKYCSMECANSGENHPQWGGGTDEVRKTIEYKNWTNKIYEKYDSCVDCGSTQNLQAHHIIPVAENKELATDVDNGVLLCGDCHSEKHPKMAYGMFIDK